MKSIREKKSFQVQQQTQALLLKQTGNHSTQPWREPSPRRKRKARSKGEMIQKKSMKKKEQISWRARKEQKKKRSRRTCTRILTGSQLWIQIILRWQDCGWKEEGILFVLWHGGDDYSEALLQTTQWTEKRFYTQFLEAKFDKSVPIFFKMTSILPLPINSTESRKMMIEQRKAPFKQANEWRIHGEILQKLF